MFGEGGAEADEGAGAAPNGASADDQDQDDNEDEPTTLQLAYETLECARVVLSRWTPCTCARARVCVCVCVYAYACVHVHAACDTLCRAWPRARAASLAMGSMCVAAPACRTIKPPSCVCFCA